MINRICHTTKLFQLSEAGVPRNGDNDRYVEPGGGGQQGGQRGVGAAGDDGEAQQLHHRGHRRQPHQQEVLAGPGRRDPARAGGGGDQDHGDGDQPPLHQGGPAPHQALPRHPLLHSRSTVTTLHMLCHRVKLCVI